MALVQQEIGRLSVQTAPVLRFLDDLTDIRYAAGDGVELNEGGVGRARDDGSQRGLAASGRAVKDGGRHAVGFDGAAEQTSLPDDMRLTDKFIQRARAHTVGERAERGFLRRKQILHDKTSVCLGIFSCIE